MNLDLYDTFAEAAIDAAEEGSSSRAVYVAEPGGLIGRILPDGRVILSTEHAFIAHAIDAGHARTLDVTIAMIRGAAAALTADEFGRFIASVSILTAEAPCACKGQA